MPLDYDKAAELLNAVFTESEGFALQGNAPVPIAETAKSFNILFESNTQSYREALVGCIIARIQDRDIDIRLPYVNQGDRAFNGRTLDERVVNPFLQRNRIPSSRGPFLSTFRRSVRFDESTRTGLRDKGGYDAFLELLTTVTETEESKQLMALLQYLLFKFVELREASVVALHRVERISLEQYAQLLERLLSIPSGGRIPVIVVLATFLTIKECLSLNWKISSQGINVADTPSGASGDVTIEADGKILLAAEVTLRTVDRSRVEATFNTKIAPLGISDYLFFIHKTDVDPEAKILAHKYFSQGLEANFLQLEQWCLMVLATLGRTGREKFNQILLGLMDAPDIPRSIKVGWNETITAVVSG